MPDRHWSGRPVGGPEARAGHFRSFALPMHDGVRIALDVHLPEGKPPSGGWPAILRQTRYYRSVEPRPITRRLVLDAYGTARRRMLGAGYAFVEMDVRGSGASGGTQPYPWNAHEVADGGRVVDWIVAQPWSSGRVGGVGISYDGTCAEHLLALRHPAVRAVAPMFSLYDAFADVGFPGGIHQSWFLDIWSQLNSLLDANCYSDAIAINTWLNARATLVSREAGRGLARLLSAACMLGRAGFGHVVHALTWPIQAGVRRIDGDHDGRLLAEAVTGHRENGSVFHLSRALISRDETLYRAPEGGQAATIDDLSPHLAFERGGGPLPGTAIYSISGWRDGGYPAAAARRHRRWAGAGSRLTLGPWIHGGSMAIQPFKAAVPSGFDYMAELIDFFDEHLLDRPATGAPVHYFTCVEGSWKAASSWPPPDFTPRPLFLRPGRLAVQAGEATADRRRVDPRTGTGERSRWRSLSGVVPGDYPDRRVRDRELHVYDSPPLAHALEVTGHPLAVVHVAWEGAQDGALFAYLEDVDPEGNVAYVTEGQLRATHRRVRGDDVVPNLPERTFRHADRLPLDDGEIVEMAVPLLPVSWLFRAGHRVRLALAGCDADHFALIPGPPPVLAVHHGRAHPSRLDLPVREAPAFHGA